MMCRLGDLEGRMRGELNYKLEQIEGRLRGQLRTQCPAGDHHHHPVTSTGTRGFRRENEGGTKLQIGAN